MLRGSPRLARLGEHVTVALLWRIMPGARVCATRGCGAETTHLTRCGQDSVVVLWLMIGGAGISTCKLYVLTASLTVFLGLHYNGAWREYPIG